jgi:hypothetical protein
LVGRYSCSTDAQYVAVGPYRILSHFVDHLKGPAGEAETPRGGAEHRLAGLVEPERLHEVVERVARYTLADRREECSGFAELIRGGQAKGRAFVLKNAP